MEVVLILANSVDPDEMQHYAAFHLGLHCLPKYLSSVQYNKKSKNYYFPNFLYHIDLIYVYYVVCPVGAH